MEPIWSVGLMTGTVLDGNIDVALLKTDGETIETLRRLHARALSRKRSATCWRRRWRRRANGTSRVAIQRSSPQAEEALTRAQSAAVKHLVESSGLSMADIGIVGFHGQSVLHRAPQPGRIGATRQLGNGALMH